MADPNFTPDPPGPGKPAADPNFIPDPAPAAAAPAADPNFEPDAPTAVAPKSVDTGEIKALAARNFAEPEKANSFWSNVHAGLQHSSAGLLTGRPTIVSPDDAPLFYKTAAGVASAVGDIPAFVAGGIGGALGGTAIAPGPGTVAGAWAGAGALPAAIRKWMVDKYEKGDVTDASDALSRVGAASLEAAKGATINVATMGTGKAVGPLAEGLAGPVAGAVAKSASELAAMTNVTAWFEKRTANAQDYINNAAVLLGMHAITGPVLKTADTLRNVYAETGAHPAEVATMAEQNPSVKQQLLSVQNPETPAAIKEAFPQEPPSENDQAHAAENPEPKKVPAPPSEPHPNFADGTPESELKVPQMDMPEPETPKERPPLSEAEQYIADKIKTAPDEVKAPFDSDVLYQRVLDQTHGLKVLTNELAGGKELSALKDPQTLARLTAGTKSAFNHAVEYGPFDPTTKELLPNVKSYKQIFEPLKKDPEQLAGFERYMVAKRVVELDGRGIKAFGEGVDSEGNPKTNVELSKRLADAGEKKYGKIAKEYAAWKNSFIDYGQKSGLFSADQVDLIKQMNQDHISFNRLLENSEQMGPGGRNLKVFNPIKSIGGSERDLVDPLKNDMLNAHKLMQMADRNRAILALSDLADQGRKAAEKAGITAAADLPDSLFQKAKTPVRPITVFGEDINKYFLDQGANPDATKAEIWRASNKDLEDNQVQAFKDGKRLVFDTTPMVAEAVRGITDQSQSETLRRFVNAPGRLLRGMQMVNPIFWERHFVRSWLNGEATSEKGESPIPHMFDAIGGMMKGSDEFKEYLRSGGANEAWNNISDYIDKNVQTLEKQTGFMDSMWNGAKNLNELALGGFHQMETALHFAKYLSVRGDDASPNNIAEAAFKARSVNGDVAMRGSSSAVKWYSAATPFWAQHMAGLAETAKAFKSDPVGAMAKMATVYTIPAVMNWWINKDDARYRNQPDWVRKMAIVIPTDNWQDAPAGYAGDPQSVDNSYTRIGPNGNFQVNNGSMWKIPMFETGMIFASLPVAVLDGLYLKYKDDPRASHLFDGFAESLFHGALPLDIPPVLHAPLEHFANRSTLTGNPIIPAHLEGKNDIAPQFKYTDYTTQSARALGQVIHQIPVIGNTSFAAPAVIENYVRNWTGSLGMYALALADKGLESLPQKAREALNVEVMSTPPERMWADNPFTTAFAVRNPTMGSGPVQEFLQKHSEYTQMQNTLKELERRGDMANYQKMIEDPENQSKLVPMDGPYKMFMEINTLNHLVAKNPEMTPHDKRQLIDYNTVQVIQTLTHQNKAVDEARANAKEAAAQNLPNP